MFFFSFRTNPLQWSVSHVISEKKVKIDIFKMLLHMVNKVNDPEVNKIVSCGKKWKKMFYALYKVDISVCYT